MEQATFESSLFCYDASRREFTVEMSELDHQAPTSKLLQDGFTMVSTRTGVKAEFKLYRTEHIKDDGVGAWWFEPTEATTKQNPAMLGVFTIVFND
jgi:hypothetical protein